MKNAMFLTLAVVSLACGCIDSKNPLSTAESAKVDEGLLGTWRHTTPGVETYYHIGLAGDKYPPGMLRIVAVVRDGKKLEAPIEYVAYTTKLNGKTYLNVVLDPAQIRVFDQSGWKADKIDGYFFVKYQLDGDKATIWSINTKAKEEAINGGKIHGLVKTENDDIRFTDTSNNVAKFIAASGDRLWNAEPTHMERIAPAKK
jgi:hypothetical protein